MGRGVEGRGGRGVVISCVPVVGGVRGKKGGGERRRCVRLGEGRVGGGGRGAGCEGRGRGGQRAICEFGERRGGV